MGCCASVVAAAPPKCSAVDEITEMEPTPEEEVAPEPPAMVLLASPEHLTTVEEVMTMQE